jgi:hypothetical protein
MVNKRKSSSLRHANYQRFEPLSACREKEAIFSFARPARHEGMSAVLKYSQNGAETTDQRPVKNSDQDPR